jgi:hypothetical protein
MQLFDVASDRPARLNVNNERLPLPAPPKPYIAEALLPPVSSEDLIAEATADMARLESRVRAWKTYSGTDVIDILANTVYALECRRSRSQQQFDDCVKTRSRAAGGTESLAAVLASEPRIVLTHAPRKNFVWRVWAHIQS